MVSLLGKMYLIHILNQSPIEELCKTQGILLIDEAENHLHPKWQKTFIQSIQEIFPNLQLIATTHSPFIVSSVENTKIFVCQSKGDHAEITDEKIVEYI
ncbi:MAG: AAA family ATPase [Pseudomonadota bacterium]